MKGSGLGKGLDALLGDSPVLDSGSRRDRAGLDTLYLDQIVPNPGQPRTHFDDSELAQLAESIRENGVLQPILVRPAPDGSDNYQIIAGERRWRAAQRASCHEVPVIIRQLDDNKALEIALVENLQRHDLNPIEEARAYRRLMTEFGDTQEAIAQRIGKSRSHLANTLRLLGLPDRVQGWVEAGELQAGHGRAILSAEDPLTLAVKVRQEGLSVRQTELLAKGAVKKTEVGQSGTLDLDTQNFERVLTTLFGLKVLIKGSGQSGEVRIRYSSPEQLDQIATKLRGQW
jgi:ParB family chromosome partitioning protein